ncbi:MAG: replicative DNA helicase [Pseudomonadota bacterium]
MVAEISLHKIPPQNIEAEQSILGSILIENGVLYDVVEFLSEWDFYREAHRRIYHGILALFEKSEPIDLVTLSNILKDQNQLEAIGGSAYLAELVDHVPIAVNASQYAKIIREKSILRSLISATSKVAGRCYESSGDVDEVLDYAESAIFEISENKITPSFYPLRDIITQSFKTLEDRSEHKDFITGVPSGFHDLDAITAGFQPSDLIIIAARPSMGKTAFALNIAENAAIESGIPVAVFSLEMSKEQLAMRLLCSRAKVDSFRLRTGFLKKEDWSRLTRAAGVLSEAEIYIDDSPSISVMEIRAKARRLKLDKNLGLVIIDYLQLMKGRASAERRELEISEISRSLKALAKELNIPVVALSQLNRKVEERQNKRPMLSDLRESGAIEQDADLISFIYRDEVYNKSSDADNIAEIIVAKQRNGPTGLVKLAFLKPYTRFEPYSGEAEPVVGYDPS